MSEYTNTDPQFQLTDETEEEFFARRETEVDQAAWYDQGQ